MNNNTSVQMTKESQRASGGTVINLKDVREALSHARETSRLEYLAVILTAVKAMPDKSFMTAQEYALMEEIQEALKDLRLDTLKHGIGANIPYEQLAYNYGRKGTSWLSKIKAQFGLTNAGQGYPARKQAERTILKRERPFIQPRNK